MSKEEEDNGISNKGFFNIRKNYPDTFSELITIKNRLLGCPKDWHDVCVKKAEVLKEIIDNHHPSIIEEKSHERCKDKIKEISLYQRCKATYIGTISSRILTEINKNKEFLSRINKNSI